MQGGDGTGPASRFVVSPRYLAAFQPKQVPHFFTDTLVIGNHYRRKDNYRCPLIP